MLQRGSKSEEVRLLQKGLSAYTKADNNLTTYNGIFGPTTEAVLKLYQKENNLPITGVYDEATQELLEPLIDYMFLKIDAIDEYALDMKVEPAALKAVYKVESKGDGFIKARPIILFEGHIFYRLFSREYGQAKAQELARAYPTIVYPSWTSKYYLGGLAEYRRYNAAISLNEEIAQMSTSYGLFQVMGFNYNLAGYESIDEYVSAMHDSEYEHLNAGCNFICSNAAMLAALRKKDWAGFALRYNGSGYKANSYDIKLAQAYKAYS